MPNRTTNILLLLLNSARAFHPSSPKPLRQQRHSASTVSGGAAARFSTNTSEGVDLCDKGDDEIPVDFADYSIRDGDAVDEMIARELAIIDGEDVVVDGNGKKLIECRASITLPFSAEVAFDAFSDLRRQPSWCKYLKSVEYLGFVHEEGSNTVDSSTMPLRESRWTVAVKGLRFSWTAKDTSITRPDLIRWESTSGMKNYGSVRFAPSEPTSSPRSSDGTEMTLRFAFVAPRAVSSLFRRSTLIRRYTEDVLLGNMLCDFRDVVLREDF